MAITFYEASVANYLQTLAAVTGVLEKGKAYCREKEIDLQGVVGTCIAPDMLPFSFQIHSVVHHSRGALEGMKSGVFRPPTAMPSYTYADLQSLIAETHDALKTMTVEEVNALEKNDVVFEIGKMKMPFTATGFLLSFSLPNFYFHSTTTYAILRSKGVPLGKRDFMGAMRMKT
jgi:hypothetical protein